MNWTIEQLNSGIKKAAADGNMDMARRLSRRALDMQKEEAQVNETGLSAEDQELFGSTTDSPIFGDGRMNQFVTGMGRGATNLAEGAKDLYMRTQGSEAAGGRTVEQEDSLDRFNRKADEERALYERGFGDSGWATAGEITGEVLPSIIPGMGIANGIRGTAMASRTGLVAAGEGGLTEFVAKRGTLGERAVAGGIGAVTGGLADKVLGYASHKYRSNKIDDIYTMELGEKPSIRVEDSANPIGLTAEGQARKQQALDDGGYRLDAADSENESFALREREALQTQGTPEYLDMRAAQQTDITARANKLNGEGYQYNAAMPDEASKLYLDGAEDVGKSLRDLRSADKDAVSKAYKDLEDSIGDRDLDVGTLSSDIDALVKEKLPYGDKALGKDIKAIRDLYLNKDTGVDKLTARDARKFVDELSSLYQDGASKKASNGRLEEFKSLVNKRALEGADAIGDSSVRQGLDTVRLAKENFATWNEKGLLGKITKYGVDGESFAKNPLKSMNTILAKGNAEEVVKIKEYMQGKPELSAAWDKVADAKRMELTAAALKANPNEFSHKAYFAAMDKMDYKMREALWGKEGADEMERTVRAWGLRNQKPETGATLNNSGSAASISGAQQIAGLGVAGYFGIPLQMLAPAMRILKGQSKNHGFDVAAKALNNGSLPPAAVKKARLELRQNIADRLDGVDANRDKNYLDALILNLESGGEQQLKDAGQAATRATARVLSTSDEEDNARADRANKLKAG
jgi:hypothetical protein